MTSPDFGLAAPAAEPAAPAAGLTASAAEPAAPAAGLTASAAGLAPSPGHDLLAGQVVVITAAAGTGIGSATARRCLAEGARVMISDHHARRLAAIRDELAGTYGDRVRSAVCDVTDTGDVEALVAAAVREFGRIDVFVNNAGLGGTSSILDMTDEQWLTVLDVTLNGTFRCTRAALRQMIAQGRGGAVVNNASVLGWRAQPGQAHYAAAKAGVMALTRCAALDVAAHGIRVNAVAPSLAMHPFLSKVMSEETLADLADREAFGRAAQPWEVANVIVFLASDYASYLTGEVVSVSSQHP
jgi:3-oxoacyl-[acyl-carrier protein] reductase